MKVALALFLLIPAAFPKTQWQRFTATAYTVEGETASGSVTREGKTVAADPAVLPFGTRIEVRGAGPYSGVYVVQDSGRKINGREIDIYIEDNAQAKRFGKKPVDVRVLPARQKP
jgi:3D (Asp-Asp-Asp) domain-containing protein